MNIAKLQSQLQHVPDQALIGYVQNPDGQVPSYLALAELTRRKEIRKSAAPQKAAPTQSVAQQAVAEVEPGIAQLPLKDEQMFSEQSYAQGGIVAFDEGGEVPRFNGMYDGSYLDPAAQYRKVYDYRNYNKMLETQTPAQVKERYGLDKPTLKDVVSPYDAAIRYYAGVAKEGNPVEANAAESAIPTLLGRRNAWMQGQKDPITGAAPVGSAGNVQGIAELAGAKAAPTVPVAEVPVVNPNLNPNYNPNKRTNIDPAQFTNKEAVGINTAGYDLPTVKAASLDLPGGLTTLDALNQRRQAMAEAGVDTDFFQKQQDKLAKEREALGGDKEKAGWMALARAGLGMAGGKSQFAVQNIAEGAISGIDQYGRDAKEIKQDEKLLRQADMKLAEAKYMQDRGDADAAYNAMQKRDDLINSTKIENVKLQQQANMTKAGLEGERSKTMFTQAQENARHKETVRAHLASAGAPTGTERVIDNIFAAMKRTNPNATYIDAFNQYNANKGSSGLDDDKILAAWNDAGGVKGTKKSFKEYKADILSGSSDKYSGWGQVQ